MREGRDGSASAQVVADIALLRAFGLGEGDVWRCARCAEAQGRLQGYVATQIHHVQTSPGIQNPHAALISNILHNRERPPAPGPPAARRLLFSAQDGEQGTTPGPAPADLPAAAGSGAAPDGVTTESVLPQALADLWRRALVLARVGLPLADYTRVLRYIQLLDLDTGAGWALLGLPTPGLAAQVERQFADYLAAALTQVCARPIRVAAAVLPGPGPQAGPRPTLATVLAARGLPRPSPSPGGSQAAQNGAGTAAAREPLAEPEQPLPLPAWTGPTPASHAPTGPAAPLARSAG